MYSTFGCCAAEAYQGRGLAVELAGAVILALAGQLRRQEAPPVAASVVLLSGVVDMLAILRSSMTYFCKQYSGSKAGCALGSERQSLLDGWGMQSLHSLASL